ncbi:MAG: hypothetical protein MUF00_04535 [Gemmatimonadaceae bacterium]|jgi:hypothetical protein|nr:hypothetical protein [Gemmatimonadaceae bacterium]
MLFPAVSRRVAPLTVLTSLLALAACSDDNGTAPDNNTPPAPSDRPAAEFRRILVTDTLPFLRTFDAVTGQRVDSMGGLPGRVTYLYSARGRVAAAHFQRQNRVLFVDGGVYVENNRGFRAAARMLGGHSDSVPIHGNYLGDIKSVHFDGSGTVSFFRESDLVAGRTTPLLSVRAGSPHHGAGIALPGGQFFSASANQNNEQLPNGVSVFNAGGTVVETSRQCSGLHGLSGNNGGVLYGCADGALHVAMNSGRPVFTKLINSADPRFGVGTVWSAAGQNNFLVRMSIRGQPTSAATRSIGLADMTSRTLRAIPLPAGELDFTATVDYSGRLGYILGRTGTLYIVDMTNGQITSNIPNVTAAFPATGTVLTPFFASAEGVTYLTNPTRGEVVEINTTAVPAIARRIAVGGTPERVEILGHRANSRVTPN